MTRPSFLLLPLVLPLASPPASAWQGADPLALEWRVPSNGNWRPGALPVSADYLDFRFRGDPNVLAGTWTELAGRVWFDDSFFTGIYGADIRYNPFREPDEWDVADLYPDELHPTVVAPLTRLDQAQYAEIVAKNEGDPFDGTLVKEFSQPLLGPLAGQFESYRTWNVNYQFWNADTLDYWDEIRSHDFSPSLLSKDALVKRLILDQQPQFDTTFFTSDAWERALQKGVYLTIQGVTLFDTDVIPSQVGNDENDPVDLGNGLGGWVAKGTSTLVPPGLIGWSGGRLSYPFSYPSLVGVEYVTRGSYVTIQMSGLRKDLSAVLRINGISGAALAPLSAGREVQDAVFQIPTTLRRGDTVEVTGFDHPEGPTSLPPSHYFQYVIW